MAGFTYNFRNPDTQYRSGIDLHFDGGASRYLTKQLFVGLAGYAYQQITDDFGQNPKSLGGFRSRVFGVGPQIGYNFPVADMQGFLGLRGYSEFGAANRPSGWNTWLTFTISPSAPTAVTPDEASGREIGLRPAVSARRSSAAPFDKFRRAQEFPSRHTAWQRLVVLKPSKDRSNSKAAV